MGVRLINPQRLPGLLSDSPDCGWPTGFLSTFPTPPLLEPSRPTSLPMSSNKAFGDFVLIDTAYKRFTHSLATALAYSRQFNFRRLESPTYGPWGMVFHELASKISPQVICIPQYTYTSSPTTNPASHDDSINTLTPQNYQERIPDYALVWLAAELRKGMKHAFKQLPLGRAWCAFDIPLHEQVPRGYMAIPKADDSLYDDPVNWHLLKVTHQHTLSLGEMKRSAGRRKPTAKSFFEDLGSLMLKGMFCAQEQADLAFEVEEDETQRIILVVGVGEWWSFRIDCRDKTIKTEDLYKGEEYAFLDTLHSNSSRTTIPPPGRDSQDSQRPKALNTDFVLARGHRKVDAHSDIAADYDGSWDDVEEPEEASVDVGEDDLSLLTDSGPDSGESDDDFDEANRSFSAYLNLLRISPQRPTGQGPKKKGRPSAPPVRYLNNLAQGRHWGAKLVWKLRDALPYPNVWSRPILWGTPASNQRTYLIKELLKVEAKRLEEKFPGTPVPEQDFDFSR
ncbi:hypothetical protein CC2G_011430 [Coprinopsis cinerea AmutBmut pab1-1]|nr:hypothetical protein CC2G_011430 [Coprinopsis cinerea AmutBmut pab1-1]